MEDDSFSGRLGDVAHGVYKALPHFFPAKILAVLDPLDSALHFALHVVNLLETIL
jgi:hypothetical protein